MILVVVVGGTKSIRGPKKCCPPLMGKCLATCLVQELKVFVTPPPPIPIAIPGHLAGLTYVRLYFSVNTKFYACVVTRKDYLERIEDGGYDREECEQYPSRYRSTFNKKVSGYFWGRSKTKKLNTYPLFISCLDRSVRFRDHQRDLLGSGLSQAVDRP